MYLIRVVSLLFNAFAIVLISGLASIAGVTAAGLAARRGCVLGAAVVMR